MCDMTLVAADSLGVGGSVCPTPGLALDCSTTFLQRVKRLCRDAAESEDIDAVE